MGNELVSFEQRFMVPSENKTDWATPRSAFSTRGGVLKYGTGDSAEEMPGNQCAAIILDGIYENAFYAEKFDSDNPVPPSCYAMGRKLKEMQPHPAMEDFPEYFKPEHGDCHTCPQNKFGTADTGRGKACKNGVRLLVIPAGIYTPERKGSKDLVLDMFTDPKDYETADMVTLKVPPTSQKFWSKYVQQVRGTHRVDHYAVVTRIFLEHDDKDQYHVCFEMLERLPDELAPVIIRRHQEAQDSIIQPYQPPQERAAPAQRGGLKGLRR